MHSGQDLWTLQTTGSLRSSQPALSRPILPVPPIISRPLIACQADPAAVLGNFAVQACEWDWSTCILAGQNKRLLESRLVDLSMTAIYDEPFKNFDLTQCPPNCDR